MKSLYITFFMLIATADAVAHETLAMMHSHVMPKALHHVGAMPTLLIVATTAVCFFMIVSTIVIFYRRLLLRTD